MPYRAAGYPQPIKGRGNKKQRDWVQSAKTRLKAGKRFRMQEREDVWRRSEDQYEGRQWQIMDDRLEGESRWSDMDLITVNMSFSTVNVIVPYMTGSEPNFLVLPYGSGASERNAAIQQAFINRLWRGELEGQRELESAAVDFLIYGDGYLKVGYEITEERVPEPVSETYTEMAKLWVQRVNPWDIWVDPTADGLHNARWVAHRYRMTRAEVEQADFHNISDENISFSRHHPVDPDESGHRRLRHEVFDDTEYATIIEFYDRIEKYTVTFSEDGDAPLRVIEDVPALPIVQVPNYRIPGSPYHMGELEQIWDVQQELNKTRTQMMVHRARNAQKVFAQKGSLDAEAREALASQEVMALVEVETQGAPMENVIVPADVANLQADVYNISDVLRDDIYEITGVNEYLRGATPTIRRTATEATIIEGASNVKSAHKLSTIERAVQQVGVLILGFAADVYPQTNYDEIQLYLTGRDAELVARLSPPDELMNEFGDEVDPASIHALTVTPNPGVWVGTYEVQIEQRSTELRNPFVKEQKFRSMFMDLLGAFPMLAEMGVVLDVRKMLMLWFEAAGIDDVEGMFVDQEAQPQDPLAEPGMPTEDPMAAMGALPPELMQALEEIEMGGDALGEGLAPDQVMGAFDHENTGMLEPEEAF